MSIKRLDCSTCPFSNLVDWDYDSREIGCETKLVIVIFRGLSGTCGALFSQMIGGIVDDRPP